MEALEYIQKDEYVEVTPRTVRMRKIFPDEINRNKWLMYWNNQFNRLS